jgi:hypothetical protein
MAAGMAGEIPAATANKAADTIKAAMARAAITRVRAKAAMAMGLRAAMLPLRAFPRASTNLKASYAT